MFFAFFGSMAIGGIVGYLSEKWGFTSNGILQSVVICFGGVFLFNLLRVMFHLSIGSPGLDAIIGAAGALALIPTHRRTRK